MADFAICDMCDRVIEPDDDGEFWCDCHPGEDDGVSFLLDERVMDEAEREWNQ